MLKTMVCQVIRKFLKHNLLYRVDDRSLKRAIIWQSHNWTQPFDRGWHLVVHVFYIYRTINILFSLSPFTHTQPRVFFFFFYFFAYFSKTSTDMQAVCRLFATKCAVIDLSPGERMYLPLIMIIRYIYNALNDALSASRIHNKLKTILSKYIHIQNRQS